MPCAATPVAEGRSRAGGLFVLGERAEKTMQSKTVLTRPRCVGCAQPMRLIRKTLRFGRLPDLYTFECQACGESHIEEAEASQTDE
jgi:hypothetical protein